MAYTFVTDEQASRFLNDLGASSATFSDIEVDQIFVMATESYPTNAVAIEKRARVIGVLRLMASAAKLTTYTQNATEEQLSDIFKHLEKLLEKYTEELAAAVAGNLSTVRFGSLKRVPSTIKDYPDA